MDNNGRGSSYEDGDRIPCQFSHHYECSGTIEFDADEGVWVHVCICDDPKTESEIVTPNHGPYGGTTIRVVSCVDCNCEIEAEEV